MVVAKASPLLQRCAHHNLSNRHGLSIEQEDVWLGKHIRKGQFVDLLHGCKIELTGNGQRRDISIDAGSVALLTADVVQRLVR